MVVFNIVLSLAVIVASILIWTIPGDFFRAHAKSVKKRFGPNLLIVCGVTLMISAPLAALPLLGIVSMGIWGAALIAAITLLIAMISADTLYFWLKYYRKK